MDSIIRPQLVETVAEELRKRFASGEIKETLPGTRPLAKAMGVSVPTLCKALHRLQMEGVLKEGGGRRRWQLSDTPPGSPARAAPTRSRNQPGRVMFVSSQPLSRERQIGVVFFAEVVDQLNAKGWEVLHRVLPFVDARKPHRHWDELLQFIKPDTMLALGGSEVLGNWANQNKLRTLFIGGTPGKSAVPHMAVRVSPMLGACVDRLFALGHRRILMPLCGRIPAFTAKLKADVAKHLLAAGIAPQCVTIAETNYSSPEVLTDLLRRHWAKQAPDALIFLDLREYFAASSLFAEMRVSIPDDLSVIILSHDDSMDWLQPPLCHFSYPLDAITRAVTKWVTCGGSFIRPGETLEIPSQWVEGKSIANRTKKARPA